MQTGVQLSPVLQTTWTIALFANIWMNKTVYILFFFVSLWLDCCYFKSVAQTLWFYHEFWKFWRGMSFSFWICNFRFDWSLWQLRFLENLAFLV
jgi:hypothetical protein